MLYFLDAHPFVGSKTQNLFVSSNNWNMFAHVGLLLVGILVFEHIMLRLLGCSNQSIEPIVMFRFFETKNMSYIFP